MDGRPTITLADLRRWEDHGATWRTLVLEDDHAVLRLCTCYGEAVDVVRAAQADVIEFVRERMSAPADGRP